MFQVTLKCSKSPILREKHPQVLIQTTSVPNFRQTLCKMPLKDLTTSSQTDTPQEYILKCSKIYPQMLAQLKLRHNKHKNNKHIISIITHLNHLLKPPQRCTKTCQFAPVCHHTTNTTRVEEYFDILMYVCQMDFTFRSLTSIEKMKGGQCCVNRMQNG